MNNVEDPTDRDTQDEYTELRNKLADLFLQYQPSLDRYQWPRESMRWNELVYCVLESLGTDIHARAAVNVLSELDLLEMDKLAGLDMGNEGTRRGQLVFGILREAGYDDEKARQALLVLTQIARKVQMELNGKLQRLLRQESESLIQNIVAFMSFTDLDPKLVRSVVTRWLQNVLNLPILLETESVRTFCAELETSPKDLVAAADDLDINMAIVDDLVEQWYKSKTESKRMGQELGGPEGASSHAPIHAQPEETG